MKKNELFGFLLAPLILIASLLGLFESLFEINEAQSIVLSILLLSAVFWVTEAIPLFATSFVIVALEDLWLLPALEKIGKNAELQNFLSPFFSDIILLFIGGFTISSALHKYGLDNRIAKMILSKIDNNHSKLLLATMIITAILSMWMSNTATAAMMLTIIFPIVSKMPEGSSYAKGLILSIPFACNIGGVGTPIGTAPNAIALSFLADKDVEISFVGWMMMTLPLVIIMLVLLWRLIMKLYPYNNEDISISAKTLEKMSVKDYFVMLVFILTITLWMTSDLHGVSMGVVALLPIIAFFGFKILDSGDFRTLSWHVLFMLGGGLSLGYGLSVSGLTLLISESIPHSGNSFYILAIFTFATFVASSFISNTAAANIMIPIAISFSSQIPTLSIVVAVICSTSMMLPISTPPNAMAFASGFITSKDMLITGSIISIIAIIIAVVFSLSYWQLII